MRNIKALLTLSTLCGLFFAFYLAIELNAYVGFFLFVPILIYLYLGISNNNYITINSEKSLAHIAVLIAIGCVALQFIILLFIDDRAIDITYVIGDSDSFLYNNIAQVISENYTIFSQVTSLEHLQDSADKFGYLLNNLGMYWVLGFLYSLVGYETGPGNFLFINLFCAMAIAHFSTKIAWHYAVNKLTIKAVVIAISLIFFNPELCTLAFTIKKDFILSALLISSCYYGIKNQWIIFVVLSSLVLMLRFVFIPIFIIIILFSLNKNFTTTLIKLSAKRLLAMFVGVIIVIAAVPHSLFVYSAFQSVNIADSLIVELKGSKILAEHAFLQWCYIIFYPFPPLSPLAYDTISSWQSLLTFLINGYLVYWMCCIGISKFNINTDKIIVLLAIWCALFFLLLLNLINGVELGIIGIAEPRYKIAWWIISCIIMMVTKDDNKIIVLQTKARL